MVRKLIVIGIDGMDYDVVRKYEDKLPNLSEMMSAHGYPRLRSVFPADTTPAWSTIYTGKDPSEHGILNFVNVGDKSNTYKPLVFDDSAFKGEAFWDVLNKEGLSCAVILPMNIKVGWEIDGLMITRPYEGKMRVYPDSKRELYSPREEILGTDGKFTSEEGLKLLVDEFFAKAAEEYRLTKLAIENEEVDLLFSYFSTTDGLQHDLWRNCDEAHPEYPGSNPLQFAIRDLYIKMDEYLGEIRTMQPDTPILVISDHGHGARPVYTARINEMLKRAGYLTPKSKKVETQGDRRGFSVKRWLKKSVLTFSKTHGFPTWAMKLAKRFPAWKRLFASGNDFDWENTRAYLSDLSALKNYSYGGIRIMVDDAQKDAFCDEVIEAIKDIEITGEGIPAFQWIRRVNTLYHGEYLYKYPEIIFQLDERYGADWNLGSELFSKKGGFMHTLSPGAHRYETATIAACGFNLEKSQYEMTDICPMILELVRE